MTSTGEGAAVSALGIEVSDLRVEGAVEPVGVDTVHPRFSWLLTSDARAVAQQRYRIRVEQISGAHPVETWDSGISSSGHPFAAYGGDRLDPRSRYRWTLTVWTSAGTAVSKSVFTTGLFEGLDWGSSVWIGGRGEGDPHPPAPLLRREFDVRRDVAVNSALLFVAAGGYAAVQVNGDAASDAVVSPGFTDYGKRVEYLAIEVGPKLHPGVNAVGIELGRGFYGMTNPNVWNWHAATWHAEPEVRALLVVTYADGRVEEIATDESWLTADGPTLSDDLYGGETYDARLAQPGYATPGFDDAGWMPVLLRRGPLGRLVHQAHQPIAVCEQLRPISVRSIDGGGGWLVEFPRVIAGWVEIRVAGESGSTLTLKYGERLTPNGGVDLSNNGRFGSGFQTDHFTVAGTCAPERWHPSFSYKGFMFVEVDGWPAGDPPTPDSFLAQVVRSAVRTTGAFASSSELFDRIHMITVDTMLNNLHGIPTDTPMFEKNGWTGDGMLGAEMFLMNFDCEALFAKWVDDIEDTRDGGAPALIAPASGSWGDWGTAPTWHSAYILVPWYLYLYTGDRRVLEHHYEGMRDYLRFELDRTPEGIADSSLGDWVSPETDPRGENPPDDRRIPGTIYLYAMLMTMQLIADVLGRAEEAKAFGAEAERIRSVFVSAFFNAEHGIVRGDRDEGFRQTHNVLALAFDMLPVHARQGVADAIAADVAERGNTLNTGALGTKYLLPVLTRFGHVDVAMRVAEQTEFPSWGFWVANGATSLWEHWKIESRSRGHYFLGTIDDWFFHDVAGIRPLAAGFHRFVISPKVVGMLEHASARMQTPYGVIAAAWRCGPGAAFDLEVDVPVGCAAEIEFPAASGAIVEESGRGVDSAPGLEHIDLVDGMFRATAGSGRYLFRTK